MKKNNFVEGTIIATLAVVLVKILGMLYVIPFYATVGSKGSALYSYAYNIYLIFLGISSAGIPIAMSKLVKEYSTLGFEEAKNRSYRLGKKIISIISVISFLILFIFAKQIAMLIIGQMSGGNTINDIAFVVRAVSFAVLVIPYLSVARGYLQGHNYITPSSISELIEQIVRIIIIVIGCYLVINVFHGGITKAIGIAMLGASIGGLFAYLYMLHKINKNKGKFNLKAKLAKDPISDQEIIKKIITYAIPLVLVSLITNIYSFANMVIILRVLNKMAFSAEHVEFITSAITTWGYKLNMIVTAIASGMTISLIPHIVSSFVKKEWDQVNLKFNKALQMIIFISLPLTLGLSFLAEPVWTVFYGASTYGPMILELSIFTAIFVNLYMIVASTLQALNKFKLVYQVTLYGFILNLSLNAPLMYLFGYFGNRPFYGAIVSSMVGYSLSIFMALRVLRKENNLSYISTYKKTLKILIPNFLMIASLLLVKLFIPLKVSTRLAGVGVILCYALIGGTIFIVTAIKLKLFEEIFGSAIIDKIIKKLTFNKVSLKSYKD